jgi:hypothetical protein
MTQNMEKPPVQYLTQEGLKERGWTDAAIQHFMTEPDLMGVNPHSQCELQIKLYSIERVEAIETADESQEWLPDIPKRWSRRRLSRQIGLQQRRLSI